MHKNNSLWAVKEDIWGGLNNCRCKNPFKTKANPLQRPTWEAENEKLRCFQKTTTFIERVIQNLQGKTLIRGVTFILFLEWTCQRGKRGGGGEIRWRKREIRRRKGQKKSHSDVFQPETLTSFRTTGIVDEHISARWLAHPENFLCSLRRSRLNTKVCEVSVGIISHYNIIHIIGTYTTYYVEGWMINTEYTLLLHFKFLDGPIWCVKEELK